MEKKEKKKMKDEKEGKEADENKRSRIKRKIKKNAYSDHGDGIGDDVAIMAATC